MTDFGDLLADIRGVRRVRHAWLTCSGTWAPPGTGYSSWVVQNADPELVYEVPVQAPWSFGPVNSPDPNAPSYRQSVAIGKQWALDWINAHPHQTFGLGGYSQGGQCASEIYLELLPGGQLASRFDDFIGGFSFGDPMRPAGVTGGGAPDPGAPASARSVWIVLIRAGGMRPMDRLTAPPASTCTRRPPSTAPAKSSARSTAWAWTSACRRHRCRWSRRSRKVLCNCSSTCWALWVGSAGSLRSAHSPGWPGN